MTVQFVEVLGSFNRFHDPGVSTNMYLQLLVMMRTVEIPAVDHPY